MPTPARTPSGMRFSSDATTPERLRVDVLYDIKRRILTTEACIAIAGNAKDKYALQRVQVELNDMLKFWTDIELITPPKRIRKKAEAKAIVPASLDIINEDI